MDGQRDSAEYHIFEKIKREIAPVVTNQNIKTLRSTMQL